jgi:circadian clock protein KaiC
MLRYQQQFTFFDPAKVDESIHFMNLSQIVLESPEKTLETIIGEVERRNPAFVVVDSFHSLTLTTARAGPMDLQAFLQQLTLDLTSRQTTAFLVGEYAANEPRDYAVFTMADGILWLSQVTARNSMVRKIQAIKMRARRPACIRFGLRATACGSFRA